MTSDTQINSIGHWKPRFAHQVALTGELLPALGATPDKQAQLLAQSKRLTHLVTTLLKEPLQQDLPDSAMGLLGRAVDRLEVLNEYLSHQVVSWNVHRTEVGFDDVGFGAELRTRPPESILMTLDECLQPAEDVSGARKLADLYKSRMGEGHSATLIEIKKLYLLMLSYVAQTALPASECLMELAPEILGNIDALIAEDAAKCTVKVTLTKIDGKRLSLTGRKGWSFDLTIGGIQRQTGSGDFDVRTSQYQVPENASKFEFTNPSCGEITFPMVISALRNNATEGIDDRGVEDEEIRIECPTKAPRERKVTMRVYNNGQIQAPADVKNYSEITFTFSVETTCSDKPV